MEVLGTQFIQLIVTIMIARLLMPEEYGLFLLVFIFTSIAGVIVHNGFNIALIQKKDADEIDFSSVFYLTLFVASLLYGILFFAAPFIASFYEYPQLSLVLRVLCLTLFLGVFISIQNSIIARKMQFKKLFISNLGAVIVSGIVGITLAYRDFGIWALVGQHLTSQLITTIILFVTLRWRPKPIFSIKRIKKLFSFGWKLLVSNLIDSIDTNIRNLLIAKFFNPALLSFYSKGLQFPNIIVDNINSPIQSVMLPTLSLQQDNKPRIKEMIRRTHKTTSFLIFPMMIGLAVIAEPLILLLLTDKWLPTVPFLQIFCAFYAIWPILTANLQAITALGRSDIFLKLEILKISLNVIILMISIPFGVHALALGLVISGFLSTLASAYPNIILFNYSVKEQLSDIIPALLIAVLMGGAIFGIHWFEMSNIMTLVIQIFVGVMVYVGLAKAFELESYDYLLTMMKELIVRKKKVSTKEVHD